MVPPAKVDLIILGDGQLMLTASKPSQSWPVLTGRLLRKSAYPIFELEASPAYYEDWIPKVLRYKPKKVVIALDASTDFPETAEKAAEDQFVYEMSPHKPDQGFEFEKGAKRAILNPEARFRVLDREDPKVGQGIRLTLEILKNIQAELSQKNISLIVVWIPTKESVYAREVFASDTVVPEIYRKVVDEESKISAKFRDALRQSGILFVDLLLPLQVAVARDQNPYDFNPENLLNATGHREIAEAVSRAITGTEGVDLKIASSDLPLPYKDPAKEDKDFELKLFVFLSALSLGLILLFTKTRDKKRPFFLLAFFLAYVFFQCLHLIEFFPMTGFQMYSFPSEKAVKYLKMDVILEDGQKLNLAPHKVLPMLADGRTKRYARDSFKDPAVANQFAEVFRKAYDQRIRKAGEPGIREIRFEAWKWDFLNDPKDPEHGYFTQRVVGIPQKSLPAGRQGDTRV